MNPNQDSFDVPVIGNADALIDWCHTADLAQYVCSALARPALTTVRQPMIDLGRAAVQLLARRLERPDAAPVTVRLPLQILLRESSHPRA